MSEFLTQKQAFNELVNGKTLITGSGSAKIKFVGDDLFNWNRHEEEWKKGEGGWNLGPDCWKIYNPTFTLEEIQKAYNQVVTMELGSSTLFWKMQRKLEEMK